MNIIKKIFFLILINFSIYNSGIAQKKPFFKIPKISSAFRAGLLNGEANKPGSELQLVRGLASKTWFAGLGAGIDYYSDLKSIPLFFEVRKDLKEKKNTPFINADMGYNLPLRDKSERPWLKYKFEGGLYYELGVGYKFYLTNSLGLALSIGYSYKNLKEKDTTPAGIGPADEPLPPQIDVYDYKFRRLSVKLGFWF